MGAKIGRSILCALLTVRCSSKAFFKPGKAIRGGVPVVFPQFGPGALPQHGFARNNLVRAGACAARTSMESIDVSCAVDTQGDIAEQDERRCHQFVRLFRHRSCEFGLRTGAFHTWHLPAPVLSQTRKVWDYAFQLVLTIVLKSTSVSPAGMLPLMLALLKPVCVCVACFLQLSMQLAVTNLEKEKSFSFTTLLHTYFRSCESTLALRVWLLTLDGGAALWQPLARPP